MIRSFLVFSFCALLFSALTAVTGGCKDDTAAQVEKLSTPPPSKNPEIPAPATGDMQMDDPKSQRRAGKSGGAQGGP